MFLQNERGLGVKNGTLGTIEQVSAQSMTVRTDDGRSVRFDLKDYNRIDHGYAATIHKAQGMTVDRAHVLATPGMDAHGSYVALSRHRDGVDLHYGRDDFASQDRLTRTLSRDRAKDMASDYERADPAQDYAERRGITFRERVAEIVRKVVPEKVRNMFDGLRPSAEAVPGPDGARRPEREAPERKVAEDPEAALRKARTKALVRHARAVDAIFDMQERGGKASPAQVKELQEARKVFEEVRPYGSHDAEAAYKKNPELVREAAGGQVNRAIRALQLETELRTDPSRRADRFVERWQKLDQASQRQYQAGDMSGYKATRSAMGDMAKSLERDPQLESILANRKQELGIAISNQAAGSARNSPSLTASTLAEAGASEFDPSDLPPSLRHATTSRTTLLPALNCLSCLVSAAVRNSQQEAAPAMREPDRIIRLKTVLSRTGLSRSTIYRKIAEGTFPPQIRISVNGSGWHESDINRWIADPVAWRPKREFDAE